MKITVVCPECETEFSLTLERDEPLRVSSLPKDEKGKGAEHRYHGPGLANRWWQHERMWWYTDISND